MKNENGMFGEFGGRFVPQPLEKSLSALEDAFKNCMKDNDFLQDLAFYQEEFIGRGNPLYYAEHLTRYCGGGKIYLKREDMNYTGSHKINNTIGQVLLAKKMGKKKIIAETGAGQHGVATATVCALFKMECTIYMGEKDMSRQALNVFKMRLLGADVKAATRGEKTLKDAVDQALEAYLHECDDAYYLLGSAVGPHPYPLMVREFQRVIGREVRRQMIEKEGRLPDCLIACVGGGSNAIGLFADFLEDDDVMLIGVEPAGEGLDSKRHAASLTKGSPGLIHGFRTITLQDEKGEPLPVHSLAAGLDYPGVGPQHADLKVKARAQYETVSDEEALNAFKMLARLEGIIPAIESAHAVAYAMKFASKCSSNEIIVVNLSGRGDKDLERLQARLDLSE